MITTLSFTFSIMLYYSCFFFSSLAMNLNDRIRIGSKKKNWIPIVIAMVFPVLLMTYRYGIGTDYFTYLNSYESVNHIHFSNIIKEYDYFKDVMPGIIVVGKIANYFGSRRLFFGVLAFFTIFPIYYVIGNEWKEHNVPLATLVFLLMQFLQTGNIIKQSIAIAILMFGITFIYKRKVIPFFLCIALGMMFHFTIIVAAPLYFLYDKEGKVRNGKKLILVIASLFVLYYMDIVFDVIGGRWIKYSQNAVGSSNMIFYFNLILLVVFVFFRKRLIAIDRRNELLIIMQLVGTIFCLIGFWSIYSKRIALYYTAPQFLLIAQTPELFSQHKQPYALLVGGVCCLYCLLQYCILNQGGMMPYGFM